MKIKKSICALLATSVCVAGPAFSQQKQVELKQSTRANIAELLQIEQAHLNVQATRLLREPVAYLKQPQSELYSVSYPLSLPSRPEPMASRALFNNDGRLLAVESVGTIDDPRRMSAATVERGMRNSNQKITAFEPLDNRLAVDRLWERVGKRLETADITEFNLNSVMYDFGDNEPRPALILRIWGPGNPLDMPDDLPEVLKNRIRYIYDIRNDELYADNLL